MGVNVGVLWREDARRCGTPGRRPRWRHRRSRRPGSSRLVEDQLGGLLKAEQRAARVERHPRRSPRGARPSSAVVCNTPHAAHVPARVAQGARSTPSQCERQPNSRGGVCVRARGAPARRRRGDVGNDAPPPAARAPSPPRSAGGAVEARPRPRLPALWRPEPVGQRASTLGRGLQVAARAGHHRAAGGGAAGQTRRAGGRQSRRWRGSSGRPG